MRILSPLAGLPHDDVEVACPGLRFEATSDTAGEDFEDLADLLVEPSRQVMVCPWVVFPRLPGDPTFSFQGKQKNTIRFGRYICGTCVQTALPRTKKLSLKWCGAHRESLLQTEFPSRYRHQTAVAALEFLCRLRLRILPTWDSLAWWKRRVACVSTCSADASWYYLVSRVRCMFVMVTLFVRKLLCIVNHHEPSINLILGCFSK